MKRIVLAPDQYYNCPICGRACIEEEVDALGTFLRKQGVCQYFLCYNPLGDQPHHYYNHFVDKADPYKIARQTFSIEVDNQLYICILDLLNQKTLISNGTETLPLEVNQVIVPDFPDLHYLVKKIRTIKTFS